MKSNPIIIETADQIEKAVITRTESGKRIDVRMRLHFYGMGIGIALLWALVWLGPAIIASTQLFIDATPPVVPAAKPFPPLPFLVTLGLFIFLVSLGPILAILSSEFRKSLIVQDDHIELTRTGIFGITFHKVSIPTSEISELVCRDFLENDCVLEFNTIQGDRHVFESWSRENAELIVRELKEEIPKLFSRLSYKTSTEDPVKNIPPLKRPSNSRWNIGPGSPGELEFYRQGRFDFMTIYMLVGLGLFLAIFIQIFIFGPLTQFWMRNMEHPVYKYVVPTLCVVVPLVLMAFYWRMLLANLLEPFRTSFYRVSDDRVEYSNSIFGYRTRDSVTLFPNKAQMTFELVDKRSEKPRSPGIFSLEYEGDIDLCFDGKGEQRLRWPNIDFATADWIVAVIEKQKKNFYFTDQTQKKLFDKTSNTSGSVSFEMHQ